MWHFVKAYSYKIFHFLNNLFQIFMTDLKAGMIFFGMIVSSGRKKD